MPCPFRACYVLFWCFFDDIVCPKIYHHVIFFDTFRYFLGFRIGHSPFSIWTTNTCISYLETRQATRCIWQVIVESFSNILLCIPNCEFLVLSFWWDLFPSHFGVWMLGIWQLAIGSFERARSWLSKPCLIYVSGFLYLAMDELKQRGKMGPPIFPFAGHSILLF